jgi:hypothetical protein
MKTNDFTTIIAIDEKHQHELKYAWRTWEKFKPEITESPVILIVDKSSVDVNDNPFIGFIAKRNNVTCYDWNPSNPDIYKDQREKMLTSFFPALDLVKTKWYLKIDTDCIAVNDDKGWLNPDFYKDDPVFVSNPWGYTKPQNTFDLMDEWGDKQKLFDGFGRLNLPYNKDSDLVRHDRIISFVYFGLTEWSKNMMSSCYDGENFKLPFPSQDTFMWYCAARRKEFYKRIKYKNFGFEHWHSFGNIKGRSLEVLGGKI